MGIFEAALILATFLCSLVAGFLFAFAVVAMPGLKGLTDGEFLRAFQGMDGIIQKNQPLFIGVWMGSVVALIAAAVLGFAGLEGTERWLLGLALVLYLGGVQLPTVAINIPLNNQLQSLDVGAMEEGARQSARSNFEPRWNRWNALRAGLSSLTSALLIVLLFRL